MQLHKLAYFRNNVLVSSLGRMVKKYNTKKKANEMP